MLKRVRSRMTYANVMASMAVFVALGGGAYALTGVPDRSGVYHGCVDPKAGALRVVAKASSCRKTRTVRRGGRRIRIPGETAIAWSQKGPIGPPGTRGIQGTQGIQGIQGQQGSTGPRGPSDAFHTTTPLGMTLPPGDYIVVGKSGFDTGPPTPSAGTLTVILYGGASELDRSDQSWPANGHATATVEGSVHFDAPTVVALGLIGSGGSGSFVHTQLTAIRVGTRHEL